MRKPKTLTERAMLHKRDAYTERICRNPPTLAHVWEREAERLLTLPGPPEVGPGGEVVRQRAPPEDFPMPAESNARYAVRNTLEQGASRKMGNAPHLQAAAANKPDGAGVVVRVTLPCIL